MNRFYRGTGVEHAVKHADVVARARATVAASAIAERLDTPQIIPFTERGQIADHADRYRKD